MLPRRSSGELYQALGVPKTATDDQIRRAYKQRALKCHPDKTGGETTEEFKRIQEANQILMDPEQRKLYDTFGREGLKRFAGEGMGGQMAAMVAENPALMPCVGLLMFLFSLLLLIFLSLLVVKIDKKKTWTWGAVFAPVWILLVPFGILVGLAAVNVLKERNWRGIFLVLLGGGSIAALGCTASALDGHLPWLNAFVSYFLVLGCVTVMDATGMVPDSYKKMLQAAGIENWEEMPGYVTFIVSNLFSMLCDWTQVFFLFERIHNPDWATTSFWLVFLPGIFRTLVPGVLMVVRALLCHPDPDADWKQKAGEIIGLCMLTGFQSYFALMLAAKCQQDYNTVDPSTHISAGVVCITIFMFVAYLFLISCVVCSAGRNMEEEFASEYEQPGDVSSATENDDDNARSDKPVAIPVPTSPNRTSDGDNAKTHLLSEAID